MNTRWSEPEIPFLMDEVACESPSTNFVSCSSEGENCNHEENVLLTCFESGKALTVRGLDLFRGFCPDFLEDFTKLVS